MVGNIHTLVVVDDDDVMRRLVRIRLEETGQFRVVGEGPDGAAAIELAQRHRPDLMVMDVNMPGTDGLAALPGVRAASPETRVVLLTALNDPEVAERAIRLGAADVLDKATGIDALRERLTAPFPPQRGRVAAEASAHPVESPTGAGAPTGRTEAHRTVRALELRDGEDRYRSIVEAVQDYAIFMLGVDGTIVTWNPGAERIKGYAAEEIIGRHFRVFYPEDVQQQRHPEHELELALRDGHYEEEGWRVRKDGTRFWANVLITAVYNAAGEHIGFAKVTRNMDERRQMLLDLEEAGAALAAANAELEAANAQLRTRAEEQAEFVAVTAHELRNPVSVLSGSAALLVQHWDDLDAGDRDELVSSITATSQRLDRLLADLLTASRLESDAIALRPERVEVGTLLATSVAAARTGTSPADVRLDAEPGLTVTGDPGRLAQVVDNLISNALRHGKAPVLVAARTEGSRVLVTVSDSGDGVPDELRPRLFQRFAAGRRNGGTGLGLFIVRELARAHGGDAWYEPGAGGGACFGLSLPAARPVTDTLVTGCTTAVPKQA
ncbi:MAG TPA: ATP-binding protein [Jatrophihabitantaceae bacterium]|nr:ATP-binding protein [Jatrophihabitantaceae bacterium]